MTGSERQAEPCLFVVFGALGALARTKLMPALDRLAALGELRAHHVLGVDLHPGDDELFRSRSMVGRELTARRLHYHALDPGRPEGWEALRARVEALEAEHDLGGNRVHYMALPPRAVRSTIEALGEVGLARSAGWVRLAIEKPFGVDQESARELDASIERWFEPRNVFRMDHYLGKETVQNLIVFRAANALIQRVWDGEAIEAVQITVAEPDGVGGRAAFYDEIGAVRDVLQNHALQLVALVAMELPAAFTAEEIHRAKIEVLRHVQPPDPADVAMGQYTEGVSGGEHVPGYLDEEDIPAGSRTETFAAVQLAIDTPRWRGVPFYVRVGKRLPKKLTQIALRFRDPPEGLPLPGIGTGHTILLLTLQPEEGFSLHFELKLPGMPLRTRRVPMQFRYDDLFGNLRSAYEALLSDLVHGEALSTVHAAEVQESWRVVQPLIAGSFPVHPYRAGSWGPAQAQHLALPETRLWQEDFTRHGRTPAQRRDSEITQRYERLALIGHGGMAEVFEARDRLLNRTVAVKVLRPKGETDPAQLMQRFRREVDVLASLTHPNIVKIFDYGETDGKRVFIAMEYARGMTLRDLVDTSEVTPIEALQWMVQVCDALAYAHKRGVIHRDLKPRNIIIHRDEPDHPVKVVDFGLAKAVDDSGGGEITETGMILGSLSYMSPEQLRGEAVDWRCDVYAVGVMLFELITGHCPDLAGSDQLPRLTDFRDDLKLPPRLDAVILKCLQPERGERYQSMDRLRRHLAICARTPEEAFVPITRGGAVTNVAQPASMPPQRLSSERRLSPLLLGALLVVAVVSLLALWS